MELAEDGVAWLMHDGDDVHAQARDPGPAVAPQRICVLLVKQARYTAAQQQTAATVQVTCSNCEQQPRRRVHGQELCMGAGAGAAAHRRSADRMSMAAVASRPAPLLTVRALHLISRQHRGASRLLSEQETLTSTASWFPVGQLEFKARCCTCEAAGVAPARA